MTFFLSFGCSFRLLDVLGAEVDDTQDDSWRGCFTVWLYMRLSLPRWGVSVDGLACPLHWPTVCCCQTRGQGLLLGVVFSCRYSGRWHLSRDVKPPGSRYLMDSRPLRYLYY
jgi:hypothetical protein